MAQAQNTGLGEESNDRCTVEVNTNQIIKGLTTLGSLDLVFKIKVA